MPIHDWVRVPAGLFHDFHQSWSIRIKDALNSGRLPKGLSALVEQHAGPFEHDVLAIERRVARKKKGDATAGLATMKRPKTRIVRRTNNEIYAARANRVIVKHQLGRIVAVVEIVSPGNKHSKSALDDFVDKIMEILRAGIHVLIIDLFPPTSRDPLGIHKVIWDEIVEEAFVFPRGKKLILASYEVGRDRAAYVEPVAVGDKLPDMPLFVSPGFHVMVPLESTYNETWQANPEDYRTAVETGIMPDPDAED
ncbi:MAG TPA: DUF4058 family protein [Gemmataceae bacterium]|jgi:hypothetical protein|nr:DUF4058 family protein [Gemmataceae bacterium]